jgi:hypothetical protein
MDRFKAWLTANLADFIVHFLVPVVIADAFALFLYRLDFKAWIVAILAVAVCGAVSFAQRIFGTSRQERMAKWLTDKVNPPPTPGP